MKKLYITLLVIIIVIITGIIFLITSDKGISTEKFNNIVFANSTNNTILIKYKVEYAQPINQTVVTSLVKNTIKQTNQTIIELENGLTIPDQTNIIKAGDSINATLTVYQPVCSFSFYMQNGTQISDAPKALATNKYQFKIIDNPICESGYKALKITSWEKIR